MIGRIEVFSREELLLQTLTDLIQAVVSEGSSNYSILIAEVYAEFLRVVLVQSADAGMGLAKPESLLSHASRTVKRLLRERLGDIQFDFSHYEENSCKTLKAPAKELLYLQERLKEARRRDELPVNEPTESGTQIPFQICEVGLKNSEIQGLIAFPHAYKCYLDFSRVAEHCTVQGNWFPFELLVEDRSVGALVFVVDQDGSIHIPTENFPTETLNRTRDILKDIASKVYVEHTNSISEWVEL